MAVAQSVLQSYVRDLRGVPLLTAEQEKQLAQRVGQGDVELRELLVRANLRLVIRIAQRYTGRGLPLQDLVSEGNLGLVRAAEGFDAAVDARFSTYAAYWIKESILRALLSTGKPIRVPSYTRELMRQWGRATSRLRHDLGRKPTREEIVQSLNLPRNKIQIIDCITSLFTSGLWVREVEEGRSLAEMCRDPHTKTPLAELAEAEERRAVRQLLGQLSARQLGVLQMRFGLDGEEPRTLQEIGDRLGVTRERVRQLEAEALKKLRRRIKDD